MTGITKRFAGVPALEDVDFDVRAGEVHALIGENGAGKSTLMNVLAGRFTDYEGRVRIGDEDVRLTDPRQALARGVAIIYQELSVLPNLTVADNIMLGFEPSGGVPGSLDHKATRDAAQRVLDTLGFETLPVDAEVGELSHARQTLVEIARALRKNVRVLVFDEPTASLGSADVQRLFATIRGLKEHGLAMVYISHRLAELPQIADRVTVLRDGRNVGSRVMADCGLPELTSLMLGRDLAEVFPERRRTAGNVVLRVRNLSRPGVFDSVSFDLREGEVLGIAGLVGSGRTEIARAIIGADPSRGSVEVRGEMLRHRTPEKCRRKGVCLVPEDRKRDGSITGRPNSENINVGVLECLTSFMGYLSPRATRMNALHMLHRMDVEPLSPEMEIQNLSGGNQQKVILGRILAMAPKVIVLDEPTQGIDVGTKAQVYKLIAELAGGGRGVILISSEFIEIANLADRILLIRDGRIIREIPGEDADEEGLFAACMERETT
jgi:ABC-type sugar transport system ATPase subunit